MSESSEKAKRTFLKAVENYAPSEWPVFLDGVCGEDKELRQQVEELLKAHEQQDSLFDLPPTEDAANLDRPLGEDCQNGHWFQPDLCKPLT